MLIHEIRNPLTVIGLASESIRQELSSADPAIQQLTFIINENVEKIDRLIKMLLDDAQTDASQFTPVDMRAMVESIITGTAVGHAARNVRLECNYEGELQVQANAHQLALAIRSIIKNAIEAMGEKAGRLSITVEKNDGNISIVLNGKALGIEFQHSYKKFADVFSLTAHNINLEVLEVINILKRHGCSMSIKTDIQTGILVSLSFAECPSLQRKMVVA